MAQGLERRDVVQDNLRGAESVDPSTRQLPSISMPNAVQVPRNSFTQQVAQNVARFAGGALAEMQEKRQKKSMRDGQLAAMQGQAFEAVEMEGDKWKLEGYRGVVAQSLSASLLRAQEQDINSGAYEQDPDTYRQTLANRIDAMTADIPDARTRELAQESLMQQMPVLIDSHMKQHLGFKEQQGFDSLAQSVDILSKDPNNGAALVSFATGQSEATQGLSDARRKEAVTQGLINAFRNDNPAAYAHLEKSGFLTTENLTAQQLDQIEAAKSQYHSRQSQQWNEEHYKEQQRIEQLSVAGEISPSRAAEMRIANDARHGRLTTYQQAGATYEAAYNGVEYEQGTRALNIQAAGIQGDYRTQAELMQSAVIKQESGGRTDAVSPKGATGIMQLMPGTAANPGYGIPTIFEIARSMGRPDGQSAEQLMRDPEVNKAMGTAYLAKMLELNNGDVELALISYNAGFSRAQEFVRAGRNWDNITGAWKHESRDYVAKITANISDNRPDPEGARKMAEDRVKAAREFAQLDAYEQSYPALNQNENLYRTGQIDEQTYRETNREIFAQYGRTVDKQWLQSEQAITQSVALTSMQTAQEGVQQQNASDFLVAMTPYDSQMQRVIEAAEAGTMSQTQVQQAIEQYSNARTQLQQQYGIAPSAADGKQRAEIIRTATDAIRKGHTAREERAVRDFHATRGTADALPPAQQKELIKDIDKRLQQKYTNYQAAGPSQPGVLEQQMMAERNTTLARAGLVDSQLKAVINSGLKQPALINGEPNPALIDSVTTYQQLKAANPAVADQYIDIGSRAVLDTITDRLGEQGNVAAAVKSFGDQYNDRVLSGGASMTTADQVKQAESFFGRNLVGRAVDRYLSRTDVGIFQGIFGSGTTGVGQAFNRHSTFDADVHRESVRGAIEAEVTGVLAQNPWASPEEVVRGASERVSRRYGMIGNQFMDFGADPYQAMFGNRAEEMRGNDDALNAAFTAYMRSPEFREQYPDSTGISAWELAESMTLPGMINGQFSENLDILTTGIRPYEAWPVPDGQGGVSMVMRYRRRDGNMSEPVNIDLKEVGNSYFRELGNSY